MTVLAHGGGAIHHCSGARAGPAVRSGWWLSALIVVCVPAMRAHAQPPEAEEPEHQPGETTGVAAHSDESDSGVQEAEDQVAERQMLAPDDIGNQIDAAAEESAATTVERCRHRQAKL